MKIQVQSRAVDNAGKPVEGAVIPPVETAQETAVETPAEDAPPEIEEEIEVPGQVQPESSGESTAQDDEQPVAQADDEETEQVEIETPPSPSFAKLREVDPNLLVNDALDEDKVIEEIQTGRQAKAVTADVMTVIRENPDLEIGLLRALKAKGRKLSDANEAKLAAAPLPEKKSEPFVVTKEVADKYNNLFAEGRYAEAAVYLEDNITRPRIEAMLKTQQAQADAKRVQDESKQAEDGRYREFVKKNRDGLQDAAKAFKSIMAIDETKAWGVSFIGAHGKTLEKEYVEVARGFADNAKVTQKQLIKIALENLGWLKGSRKTADTKTVQSARPAIRNVTVAKRSAKPAEEGQVRVSFTEREIRR